MIEERWAKVEAAVQDFSLPEQKKVLARLSDYIREQGKSKETEAEAVARQKKARMDVRARVAKLPVRPNDDPDASVNHDKYIYGVAS